MSRGARYALFFVGAGLLAVLYVRGIAGMPEFGSVFHPYRDRAVHAAVAHATANVVSAVNFDQRGFDTLGEETIFLAAVVGATALLRPSKEEREQRSADTGRVMASTRLAGYVLLPLTILVGIDVVTHGHLTPGGGFQGGVVLATAAHLLYVAGRFGTLEKLRPFVMFEYGEVLGALAFGGLGIAALAIAGSYLSNVIPFGTFGQLLSAGTVAPLNFAVGIEVGCGVMVLLRQFLEQAITLHGGEPGGGAR
jgi:multicomponent Na+:H+ antiporter subunit B